MARDDDLVCEVEFTFRFTRTAGDWPEESGLYGFVRQGTDKRWEFLYVGQADNLGTYLPNHRRWQEAQRDYGATHIVYRPTPNMTEPTRKGYERVLVHEYQPPMNSHYR